MAQIKSFKNGSCLIRFQAHVHDKPYAATAHAIYRQRGGIRNFVRYVLAFIREQSDECVDAEDDDTLGED